jgi:hypothetical protein
VLQRREGDPGEPARPDHQHLARVAQVGRQEDDDRDLRELGGLKRDRAEVEGQIGAVDRAPQARQQQQQDAAERDDVAVALQHAVVAAQRDDRRGEEDQPDDEPLRLHARELLVEAVEHHEAEAGEDGDEREEVRVGVGQRHAQHEVGREAQRQEDRAVGQRQVGEQVLALDEHRGEAGRQQQRRRDQREQLAVAGAHAWAPVLVVVLVADLLIARPRYDAMRPRSSSRTRSDASSCERRVWSTSCLRRAVGSVCSGTLET